MSFKESIMSVLNPYVNFSGRARRSEYWWFCLANIIVSFVLSGLYQATGLGLFSVLSGLYSLAVLIPGLGVCVRRLHDVGKGWGWIFISLVPLVGAIILIIFMASDSQPGTNQYGPNPKGL